VFTDEAKALAGNGGAVAGQRLSLPGECSYQSISRRTSFLNFAVCAVMYTGRVRTVWGDKKLEGDCSPSSPSSFLSPQAL